VGAGQYQTDGDTGLLLLGHRYYDASVGRFLTVDPAQAGNNWYAYCGNNPLGGMDATGLQEDFTPAALKEAREAAWDLAHPNGPPFPYPPIAPPPPPVIPPPPPPPNGGPGLGRTVIDILKWTGITAVGGVIGNEADSWLHGGGPGQIWDEIKQDAWKAMTTLVGPIMLD